MTQKLLQRADVATVLEQMGRGAVAKGVAARRLRDLRLPDGALDGTLERGFAQVVAPHDSAAGVSRTPLLGKDILPAPVPIRPPVLPRQGGRQVDRAEPRREIGFVDRAGQRQLGR